MADRPTRHGPARLALLVLLGAAAAAGSSAMTWWTQAHRDALSGTIATGATGSRLDAVLVPAALLALAGFGAALATSGLLRRLVGAVLTFAGLWAATTAVVAMFSTPGSLRSDLTRPPESSGSAQLHPTGPLLATVGGLLIAVAGLLLLAGLGARRSLGPRYDAPTGRQSADPDTAGPPGGGAESPSPQSAAGAPADPATDPEAASRWWKALDGGQDPTDPAVQSSPRADPAVSDQVNGGG